MQTIFFPVKTIGQGRLFIMPCPRSEQLAENMASYMAAGMTKVVCLMESEEMAAQGLSFERHLCDQLGMRFEHFPLRDRSIPRSHQSKAFRDLVERLYTELNAGQQIGIHCYAGIGRTGVLTGCLLMRDGMSPHAAIDLMSNARGHNMPQTQEQYDFLLEWEVEPAEPIQPSRPKVSWFRRLMNPA